MAGAAIIVLVVVGALVAPWLPYADEGAGTPNPSQQWLPPSMTHLLGTDYLGRDMFSRILFGARVSLVVASAVVAITATIGSILGAIAGYVGGWVDEAIMRVTDMVLSFPSLLLAIVVGQLVEPGVGGLIVAISASWWPWYTRLVRGQAVALRERQYVVAARSMGASGRWIITNHILRNVVGPVRVQAAYDFGAAIRTAAALSFLGLGPPSPTADWGSMISEGRAYLLAGEWGMVVFPGIAIYLTVVSFNLVADAIQAATDPVGR